MPALSYTLRSHQGSLNLDMSKEMNKSKAKSLIVASANFQLLKKNAEEALSIVDKQMASFLKSRGWSRSCWGRKNWDNNALDLQNFPTLDAFIMASKKFK
jgi:hypothetical protein